MATSESWKTRAFGVEVEVTGPEHLRELAESGDIQPSDYVFNPVLQRWMYARDVEEIADVLKDRRATKILARVGGLLAVLFAAVTIAMIDGPLLFFALALLGTVVIGVASMVAGLRFADSRTRSAIIGTVLILVIGIGGGTAYVRSSADDYVRSSLTAEASIAAVERSNGASESDFFGSDDIRDRTIYRDADEHDLVHRAHCPLLTRRSGSAINAATAMGAGLGPCSRCRPFWIERSRYD